MEENLSDGGDQVADQTTSEPAADAAAPADASDPGEAAESTEPASDTDWHDLHTCPNGHVEGVHRGLNDMEQGKNAVKYIYGYHCLTCDASWTASEIFKL